MADRYVTDADRILSAYGPVILAAQGVRNYYGCRDDDVMRMCNDAVGELLEALSEAERTCGVIEPIPEEEQSDGQQG